MPIIQCAWQLFHSYLNEMKTVARHIKMCASVIPFIPQWNEKINYQLWLIRAVCASTVWLESSLGTLWLPGRDPMLLHADNEVCSDWADVQAIISLCCTHTWLSRFCYSGSFNFFLAKYKLIAGFSSRPSPSFYPAPLLLFIAFFFCQQQNLKVEFLLEWFILLENCKKR